MAVAPGDLESGPTLKSVSPDFSRPSAERANRASRPGGIELLRRDWYGDRLDPAWRPRGAEESQRILGAHGLEGLSGGSADYQLVGFPGV